jgi:hypothetical protein
MSSIMASTVVAARCLIRAPRRLQRGLRYFSSPAMPSGTTSILQTGAVGVPRNSDSRQSALAAPIVFQVGECVKPAAVSSAPGADASPSKPMNTAADAAGQWNSPFIEFLDSLPSAPLDVAVQDNLGSSPPKSKTDGS